MRVICRTVCPSIPSGTLNGAGSSSAQRGAGVAAQVVIQGSVPADLAAPVGAAAARANIPTARHVDDKSPPTAQFGRAKPLDGSHGVSPPRDDIYRILRSYLCLRRSHPDFLRTISAVRVSCLSLSIRASRAKARVAAKRHRERSPDLDRHGLA